MAAPRWVLRPDRDGAIGYASGFCADTNSIVFNCCPVARRSLSITGSRAAP